MFVCPAVYDYVLHAWACSRGCHNSAILLHYVGALNFFSWEDSMQVSLYRNAMILFILLTFLNVVSFFHTGPHIIIVHRKTKLLCIHDHMHALMQGALLPAPPPTLPVLQDVWEDVTVLQDSLLIVMHFLNAIQIIIISHCILTMIEFNSLQR